MTWSAFFKIVELRTKLVSLSTFVLASFSVYWTTKTYPWELAVLLFVAVLAVDMGTTAFNTFFDYERGVDTVKTNVETDKVLVHEKIPAGWALLTALSLFAVASGLGIFLVILSGWPLLILGLLSLLVAYRYSGGKTPISSTPFGEFFAGFFLGTVLWVIVFFVLSTPSHWKSEYWGLAALYSLPSFFFIASILTVNNCCDRVGDAQAGRKTLSIVGGSFVDSLVVVLPLFSYAISIGFSITGLYPVATLYASAFGLVVTLWFWKGMFRRGFRHETKGPQMQAVSQTFLLFTLCQIVAWTIGVIVSK